MNNSMPRFLTLEAWVAANYGDALSINTARRWVRDGYIFPAPEKHGRAYYLERDARYVDPANPPADLKPTGREPAESFEQYARRRIAEMWSAWRDGQLPGYGELSIEETMALIEAEYYGRLN